MSIEDLLIDFDEMGFAPTTICPNPDECACEWKRKLVAEITRQQAEIERLKDEASKARRKALLEASSKFAGHSDYHGDTILCKLICMAEGKEVGIAKPLDTGEIKFEAIKEFAERLKEKAHIFESGFEANEDRIVKIVTLKDIDNLLKEMVGDTE